MRLAYFYSAASIAVSGQIAGSVRVILRAQDVRSLRQGTSVRLMYDTIT
jgi:hypothetical protein